MKTTYLKINKSTLVEILFLLLMGFIFVRYGLEWGIPTSILLIIALLIVSIGNCNEIVAMCLGCIPLYNSFDYLYVVLYGCVVLLIKNAKKIKVDITLMLVVLILVWELLHSLVGPLAIKQLVGVMVPYLLVVILHSCRNIKYDYSYISHIFVRFVALTASSLFVRNLIRYGGNILYTIQRMGRLGYIDENSTIGGEINPNSLGIMCVLAITLVLQKQFAEKKERKNIIYLVFLMTIGFLTLSRTYIVLLVIMFCTFIIEQKGSTEKKTKIIGVIIGILLIGTIILFKVFPTVIETFGGRWMEKDLSNGRFFIMEEAVESIWSNPSILLFGLGLQEYSEKVLNVVSYAPHDALNEVLMAWGLPGLCLFGSFLIVIVISAKKRNKNIRLINYIPLILMIAKAIAGHWITSGYSMLAISLVYLSLIHDFGNLNIFNKQEINRTSD